jgi:hypothetical protein
MHRRHLLAVVPTSLLVTALAQSRRLRLSKSQQLSGHLEVRVGAILELIGQAKLLGKVEGRLCPALEIVKETSAVAPLVHGAAGLQGSAEDISLCEKRRRAKETNMN